MHHLPFLSSVSEARRRGLGSKVLTFAAALVAAACGYMTTASDSEASPQKTPAAAKPSPVAPPAPVASEARVAGSWQDHMLKELASRKDVSEAYGLFSEGGWSNDGQIIIYVPENRKTPPELVIVPPNKKEAAPPRQLTAAEWEKFQEEVAKARELASIDVEAFDALTFEYVHAVKEKENVTVAKRIYVRNPGIKKAPAHDQLIAAFQALRKT